MSDAPAQPEDVASAFLSFYDDSLPQVYGYLRARCPSRAVAEDLTAETFLAAVDAVRRDNPAAVSVPWIIGVARHKLVDHWRRSTRETRGLRAMATPSVDEHEWDPQSRLDEVQARSTLESLSPHHRAALTLRYVDDLPVPEVARLLGRSLHATEGLLTRARRAFRIAYGAGAGGEETRDA